MECFKDWVSLNLVMKIVYRIAIDNQYEFITSDGEIKNLLQKNYLWGHYLRLRHSKRNL